jgi:oligoribonuclease NrnB/cAMP/cGMP phosphodiesterase (DHH superfamily)
LIRYPQASTFFLGYGIESFRKLARFIRTEISSTTKSGIILISDLGMNENSSLIEICCDIFNHAEQNKWKVTWIDHHPWPKQAVNIFTGHAELVLDDSGNKCAAELMHDFLLKDNKIAAKLADMAHSMDFFTKTEYLTPVAELIRYYSNFEDFYERLDKLARKAAIGILWDIEMQVQYGNYVKIRDHEKELSISSMKIKNVDGVKVVFVRSSPYIQNSLFADELFSSSGADVVMLYNSKGDVSIRRNNSSIACNEIADNLSLGGGHQFAAGASFSSNPQDTDAVVAELEMAVRASLRIRKSNT